LLGYLEGTSVSILPEPHVLLTATPKVPGLDGRKMSKSYGNTIGLREDPDEVARKLKTMQTDPARVRRTDPGNPDICPVFDLHKIYSSEETRIWAANGCRTAGIGCLECKKPLIDSVLAELAPIRERARAYEANPARVAEILDAGCKRAREAAHETMQDVRAAVGLDY
jgi:tryptophanyl-tRNA synthetase